VPGYGWEAYALSDPYDDLRKFIFEDCYRSDPVIRRCLNLIADVVLGTRMMTVMDIDEEFTADQIADGLKTQRLKEALSDQEKVALQTEVDHINRICKLRINSKAAMIQSKLGGRAVLEKIIPTGSDGLPTELRILNWKKLGTVYINPKTWRMIAIEYADRPQDKPLLPSEIIHFENDDFEITPDSRFYGVSDVEAIAATSEINRLLDEADLKEVAKTRWSPTGQIIFPPDTDTALIQAYMDALTMGTMNGTDMPLTFQQFDLTGDIDSLVNLRIENDRRIARLFGLPNPVIGFENITNRATVDTVLRFYHETEVKDLRTWLQDTLEPQWFDPILEILAPELLPPDRIQYNDAGNPVKMSDISEVERNRLAAIRDITEEDPEAQPDKELARLPKLQARKRNRQIRKPVIKIKLEFESVSMEPLLEVSQALMPLWQQKLLPTRELLKQLKMPQAVEQAEIMQEAYQKEQEQKYQDQVALSKQSIEVGRQRMAQSSFIRSQKQNKTASIQDQMLFDYQHKNQASELELRHRKERHDADMEYIKRKNAFVSQLQKRYEEELSKG